MLGSVYGHIGFILASCWGHVGVILESVWDHVGVILGSFPIAPRTSQTEFSRLPLGGRGVSKLSSLPGPRKRSLATPPLAPGRLFWKLEYVHGNSNGHDRGHGRGRRRFRALLGKADRAWLDKAVVHEWTRFPCMTRELGGRGANIFRESMGPPNERMSILQCLYWLFRQPASSPSWQPDE